MFDIEAAFYLKARSKQKCNFESRSNDAIEGNSILLDSV